MLIKISMRLLEMFSATKFHQKTTEKQAEKGLCEKKAINSGNW
jgi:hypothetical protein